MIYGVRMVYLLKPVRWFVGLLSAVPSKHCSCFWVSANSHLGVASSVSTVTMTRLVFVSASERWTISVPHVLVTSCYNYLTCPTSVATIFVAHRKHGSFLRNVQEELEAALLFHQLFIRWDSTTDCLGSSIFYNWMTDSLLIEFLEVTDWLESACLFFLYIFPPLSKNSHFRNNFQA
jgi:hypothetical protein